MIPLCGVQNMFKIISFYLLYVCCLLFVCFAYPMCLLLLFYMIPSCGGQNSLEIVVFCLFCCFLFPPQVLFAF